MDSFDVHRGVNYTPITNLFWGKYPFRVTVNHGVVPPNCDGMAPPDAYVLRAAFDKAKKRFLKRRTETLSGEPSDWKVRDNTKHSYSFFFVDAETAKRFVASNLKHVRQVSRPQSLAEIDYLKKSRKSKIKTEITDMLYWSKYRYKIEFKRSFTPEDWSEFYDWFDVYLLSRNNTDTCWLTGDDSPNLFLNSETDIMVAMMGVNDLITSISKSILREEIVS
jgi:hypothetical protein